MLAELTLRFERERERENETKTKIRYQELARGQQRLRRGLPCTSAKPSWHGWATPSSTANPTPGTIAA